jgi:hypothetical protein
MLSKDQSITSAACCLIYGKLVGDRIILNWRDWLMVGDWTWNKWQPWADWWWNTIMNDRKIPRGNAMDGRTTINKRSCGNAIDGWTMIIEWSRSMGIKIEPILHITWHGDTSLGRSSFQHLRNGTHFPAFCSVHDLRDGVCVSPRGYLTTVH